MSNDEIKNRIKIALDQVSNPELLEAIDFMLTYRGRDWANDLSEEERKAIYKGIEEAEAGNVKPYNEVREKLNRKYGL